MESGKVIPLTRNYEHDTDRPNDGISKTKPIRPMHAMHKRQTGNASSAEVLSRTIPSIRLTIASRVSFTNRYIRYNIDVRRFFRHLFEQTRAMDDGRGRAAINSTFERVEQCGQQQRKLYKSLQSVSLCFFLRA